MAVAIAGLVRGAAVRAAERGIERRARALLRLQLEIRDSAHCPRGTQKIASLHHPPPKQLELLLDRQRPLTRRARYTRSAGGRRARDRTRVVVDRDLRRVLLPVELVRDVRAGERQPPVAVRRLKGEPRVHERVGRNTLLRAGIGGDALSDGSRGCRSRVSLGLVERVEARRQHSAVAELHVVLEAQARGVLGLAQITWSDIGEVRRRRIIVGVFVLVVAEGEVDQEILEGTRRKLELVAVERPG